MKQIASLLALLLYAVPVQAQTTQSLVWEHAAVASDVQTYTFTVTIDGQARTGQPTCAALPNTTPARTTCTLALTPLLSAGSHSAVITATKAGNTSETRVTGLNTTGSQIPTNAEGIKVQVTVIVTVP